MIFIHLKGSEMGIYFGTDGLRGVYGEEVTPSIAFKCGNSLSRFCELKKIVIGKDPRVTGDILALSITNGLMQNGVDVIDVGLVSTPAIAYLSRTLGCDFGVMISASHNPPEYNGIKIFDKDGYKISEELENQIERKFMFPVSVPYYKTGRYTYKPELAQNYIDNISASIGDLGGLKVVLDCGNGACSHIAKKVFKKHNAKVYSINDKTDGLSINADCGALHPSVLAEEVRQKGADIGISFDGDADRIIACDENGHIIDGDDILYLLAGHFKNCNAVVGTSMTNKGLENALNRKKINLFRADVGDKYVIEVMKNKNILLGGEPSGHIILKNYSTTGDGLLVGLILSSLIKKASKPLSKLINYKKFPQININVVVIDKYRILNSEKLSSEILALQQLFGTNGRVLVRASGTENKIRIMCEHKSKTIALRSAQSLEEIVKGINRA